MARHYIRWRRPAMAPVMQVAMDPASMDFMPSWAISRRRLGTMAPIPPTIMPMLPKLANPQML